MLSAIDELLSNRFTISLLDSGRILKDQIPTLVKFFTPEDLIVKVLTKNDFVLINGSGRLSRQEKTILFGSSFLSNANKVFIVDGLTTGNCDRFWRRLSPIQDKLFFIKSSLFFENLLDKSLSTYLVNARLLNQNRYWVSGKDFARQLSQLILNHKSYDSPIYIQGLQKLNIMDFLSCIRNNSEWINAGSLLYNRLLRMLKWAYMFSRIIPSFNTSEEQFKASKTWTDLGCPVIRLDNFLRMIA